MKNILKSMMMLIPMTTALASSHREAPLIANDPLADNTDLYAFRSPDNPNTVTIIANYIPAEIPHAGPNFYSFGEDIRYEIHIDNDANVSGDEITYRFTFNKVNEDPTTFFNIRLGMENLKTTYTLEKSTDGGATFTSIITNGVVPPNNIGDRSITGGAGLGSANYEALFSAAIKTATTGEKVFCGPVDDPFFVDLGGIFDLGDAPRQAGGTVDALKCLNVHSIAIQIPIEDLSKTGAPVSSAANILDSDYIIGVWASASRKATRTLTASTVNMPNSTYTDAGSWIQVSRLGMPLTNEAIMPIGQKDFWNSLTPYQELAETTLDKYFFNPELGLYMDDDRFGGAVPAFADLRMQENSLGSYDFSNDSLGLYGLKGNPALAGTALDDAVFGTLLLPNDSSPRSVDLWPIFHTGVPNLEPYQLATGKGGNVLASGKPFINNFLPNGGDMLRLNMAVPVTPRNSADFSSLGLVQAAVLGLTDPTYNGDATLQAIPNMDGFPNGRRLEDDVTRIELQAVGGIVLAAVGLFYDDYDPNVVAPLPGSNPVSPNLLAVLGYSTGVEANDTLFRTSFPFVQLPWKGNDNKLGLPINYTQPAILGPTATVDVTEYNGKDISVSAFPNPVVDNTTITYEVESDSKVSITLYDVKGRIIANTTVSKEVTSGSHTSKIDASNLASGVFFAKVTLENESGKAVKLIKLLKK